MTGTDSMAVSRFSTLLVLLPALRGEGEEGEPPDTPTTFDGEAWAVAASVGGAHCAVLEGGAGVAASAVVGVAAVVASIASDPKL
jgi:hypothetical protein